MKNKELVRPLIISETGWLFTFSSLIGIVMFSFLYIVVNLYFMRNYIVVSQLILSYWEFGIVFHFYYRSSFSYNKRAKFIFILRYSHF